MFLNILTLHSKLFLFTYIKARVKGVLSKMKALSAVEAVTKNDSSAAANATALKPSTKSLFEAVNTTMITNAMRSKALRSISSTIDITKQDGEVEGYHILGEEDFNPVLLDENEAGDTSFVGSNKSPKFQPELPPIHLAAAQGDLARLKQLTSEDERIFISVSQL